MDDSLDRVSQLSLTKRRLLQRALQEKLARKSEASVSTIQRAPEREHIPLSFMQQRLWFLAQLETDNPFYNAANVQHLKGSLQAQVFEQCIQEIVRRHDILRTTFISQDGHPIQIIAQHLHVIVPFIDLTRLTASDRDAQVQIIAREEARRPFHLSVGPLLRMTLLRLSSDEHVLVAALHHIVCDGWSVEICTRELSALYNAFTAGKPSPLSDLPIQYADFALWQRQRLQGETLERLLCYWTERLKALNPLELPTDYPRPALQTYHGAHLNLLLPLSLSKDIKRLSQRENVTLFMILLAAFQTLLFRYTGQSDIAIGTDVANRTRREVEGLIGFFANTLVMRTELAGDLSFLDLLQRVREVALGAYAHQELPFEKLVEALQPERDLSRSPLFQVFLSVQHEAHSSQTRSFSLAGLTPRHLALENNIAKFDLNLTITETEQGLACVMEYNTNLFQARTITRLLTHFHTLLTAVAHRPQQSLARLPLLSEEERIQLLYDWNATACAYPSHLSLAALFARQAARTPERIAVVYQEAHLTYRQLDARANWLAHQLQERGVSQDVLVGLYLERSIEMLISMLAVFKVGGAYVPLDPAYPRARLESILADAPLAVLLTSCALWPALPATSATVLCLEEAGETAQESHIAVQAWSPDQLAYVIYTSGSTGHPKGVMVQQGGMLNHLFAKIEALQISADDVVAQTASPCFDISVWQFLAGLLCGARVHILPDEVAHDPAQLWPQTAMQAVSILELVPSLLQQVLDEQEQAAASTTCSLALRWLLATGEALSAPLAQRWLTLFPHIPLLNAYGPTECSDDVTHACISQSSALQMRDVPLGRPIGNLRLYVLDAYGEPLPAGMTGEIYVGGVGLGRGYLHDPARTAAAFVPDPYGEQPGGRLYRTGDLGAYQADGQLRFLGRTDEQVKVRGYRIELGEIKAALQRHPQVGACEVIAWESSPGDRRLVAYVVGRGSQIPPATELRSYLTGKLPEYMLPSFFLALPALPVTSNGKVDRRALPTPEIQEAEHGNSSGVALNPIEEMVTAVWKEVLGRAQVDLHDDFFMQGGHSLLATQVVARLRTILHAEIPLRSLFETPTIAGLSTQIARILREKQGMAAPPLKPVSRKQNPPLSFAQQRLWFIDQVEPGNVAYNASYALWLRGNLRKEVLTKCLDEIIRRHEILRTTFQLQGDEPVQIIAEVGHAYLPLIDLSSLLPKEREVSARKLIQQEARSPFDLARGPLLRTRLLYLGESEHVLQSTLHHIIVDRWSQGILSRELATLYQAFSQGRPSPLAALPLQYADFAYWQRTWLQGEVLDAHIDYWARQLRGVSPPELPADRPAAAGASTREALHSFKLSAPLSEDLMSLSRREGVTLFMTLLTAFQILLYRYTRQQDIVVGTDIANRTSVETEGIIGFFVNLLVLRTNLSGEPTFREVLQRVRSTVLDAYTYQDLPFEKLIEALQLERTAHEVPLVRVLLVLQNVELVPLSFQGLEVYRAEPFVSAAKFDLAVFIEEGPEGLAGIVNYRSALFDPGTIEGLIEHFDMLLHSIVSQPDEHIASLEMYSEAERREQMSVEASHHEAQRRKLKTVRRKIISLAGSDNSQ